jgi:hypothetical protein
VPCVLLGSFGRTKEMNDLNFVFPKIIFTFDPTNQIFLPLKGRLVFIKKGEEIRLCETLATNPPSGGERCQNLIPERREMIKI